MGIVCVHGGARGGSGEPASDNIANTTIIRNTYKM